METTAYHLEFRVKVKGQGNLVSRSIMGITGVLIWLIGVISIHARLPRPPV